MTNTIYSNLPIQKTQNSDLTLQSFSAYYLKPIEIQVDVLQAMTGFFQNKGFNQTASENISIVIISQAKKDNYNPMTILDTLKGLDEVELSALVIEILNYNRYKTSFLGYAQNFITPDEILRNIQA